MLDDQMVGHSSHAVNKRIHSLFLYQYLLYLFSRSPWLFKICYFLFIQPGHWLKGESIQQNMPDRLRRTVIFQNICRGSDFFIDNIGIPIFLGLLAHDFIAYFTRPENRYGTTVIDILAGTAHNHDTLTGDSSFDVVTETNFYLRPALLFGSWFTTIFLYSLFNRSWSLRDRQFEALDIATLNPLSWRKSSEQAIGLGDATTQILWKQASDGDNYEEEEESEHDVQMLVNNDNKHHLLVGKIITIAQERSLRGLIALSVLADMIMNQPLGLNAGGRSALEALKQAASWHSYRTLFSPLALYHQVKANYLLWSLGRATGKSKIPAHLIFWIFPLLKFYVKARFIELLVFKTIQVVHFFQDKKACHDLGKQWLFMQVTDRYECSDCGDWSFVSYRDQFNASKCIEALFARVTDPDLLASYLTRFSQVVMSSINLSAQNLASWSEEQWVSVLNAVQTSVAAPMLILNMAQNALVQPWMANNTIDALTHFIMQMQVQCLDLTNQMLGPDLFERLLSQLLSSAVQALYLAGNALGDRGAIVFQNHTNFSRALTVLDLSENSVTDLGITALVPAIQNGNLTQIILRNNLFSDIGINLLSALFTTLSYLQSIDLSNNGITSSAAKILGAALPNTTIESFFFSAAQISDHILADLMRYGNQTGLQYIDFSLNKITGAGFQVLLEQLKNSLVKIVMLSHNILSYELNLTQCLQNMIGGMIQCLDLSFNQLEANHFALTQNLWANTSIQNLYLSGNPLTDAVAYIFQNAFSGWHLNSFVVSNCALTETGVSILVDALPSSITALDLSFNSLSPSVFSQLIQALLYQLISLVNLSLEATQIDFSSVQNLAEYLSLIKLQVLNLANNHLNSDALISLAVKMIKQIPYMNSLSDHSITRDEKRAITQVSVASGLEKLNVTFNDISDLGARAICRIWSAANNSINGLSLQDNRINSDEVDVQSCFIADNSDSTNRMDPFALQSLNRREISHLDDFQAASEMKQTFLTSLLAIFSEYFVWAMILCALSYFIYRLLEHKPASQSTAESNETSWNIFSIFSKKRQTDSLKPSTTLLEDHAVTHASKP